MLSGKTTAAPDLLPSGSPRKKVDDILKSLNERLDRISTKEEEMGEEEVER